MKLFKIIKAKEHNMPLIFNTFEVHDISAKPSLPLKVFFYIHKPEVYVEFVYKD